MDDPADRGYSRAPELEDLARVCRALNECGALYLLIGGFAVILHGFTRTTKDVDLLVDASPENVRRVKSALAVLSDNAVAEVADDDIRTYTIVRVADEIVVDLMGSACGIAYETAKDMTETFTLNGVEVPVASKELLIRLKDTVRPSDHADVAFLRALIAEEESG